MGAFGRFTVVVLFALPVVLEAGQLGASSPASPAAAPRRAPAPSRPAKRAAGRKTPAPAETATPAASSANRVEVYNGANYQMQETGTNSGAVKVINGRASQQINAEHSEPGVEIYNGGVRARRVFETAEVTSGRGQTVVVGMITDDGRKEGGASPVVTGVASSGTAGTGGAPVATEAPQRPQRRPPYRRPAAGTPR